MRHGERQRKKRWKEGRQGNATNMRVKYEERDAYLEAGGPRAATNVEARRDEGSAGESQRERTLVRLGSKTPAPPSLC